MRCPRCGVEIKTKVKHMGHYAPLKGERYDYGCRTCKKKYVVYEY